MTTQVSEMGTAHAGLTIGLTGGIGSGKSRVAQWLETWGAWVVDTDAVAHALTGPDGAAMPTLAATFGSAVQRADGAMDRDWMRARVFAEPAVRAQLEAILHPMIRAQTQRLLAQSTAPYRVVVVPLLLESGDWRQRVDRVCVVDCDPDTQVARVQARSGLTTETIRRIMAVQATREQRLAAAQDVILNDGSTDEAQLHERVLACHQRWLQLAAVAARAAG